MISRGRVKSRISEDVQSVTLYRHRHILLHLYAVPFAILYLAWAAYYFHLNPDGVAKLKSLDFFVSSNSSLNSTDEIVGTGDEAQATSISKPNLTSEEEKKLAIEAANDLPDISNLSPEELWLVGAALLGILHLLLCLSCVWSVHIRCIVTCNRVKKLSQTECVKVVPTPNNGFEELVPIQKRLKPTSDDNNGTSDEYMHWIEFQKTVLVCEDESKAQFEPVSFPVDWSFKAYSNWKGYENVEKLKDAQIKYGKNDMEMVLPKFKSLMAERATAPFFVFQVFCVGLWCLDEAVYYSLFTLFMLVIFEATLVQQQIKNMSTIRDMGNKPTNVYVYRNKKWDIVLSNEIVSGDIISVSNSAINSTSAPSSGMGCRKPTIAAASSGGSVSCDLLLLRGQCIVDEAMLTGESVPQMKEPISDQLLSLKQSSSSSSDSNSIATDESHFNLAAHGKLHVIYGGTKVLQSSFSSKSSSAGSGSDNISSSALYGGLASIKAPPDHGCMCFVLRTGFNTSQGKLLRTILFGVKRITANNLETFFFILFLLIFAVSASSYVWIQGTKNPARSRYKLLLECTLIITSVVPPELPIELSLAVNNSMIALAKVAIFCTEPFRIPFAGKIDFCCFDKTGTLTSDTFIVEGVAGLKEGSHRNDDNDPSTRDESSVTPISEVPKATLEALATCHSLGHMTSSSAVSAASSSTSDGASGSGGKSGGKDSSSTLIGDPLEKVTFSAIQYTLSKNDVVSPPTGASSKDKDMRPWQIVTRFHFTSKLKRMTTLAAQTSPYTGETMLLAAVKGAPETLKNMFESAPDYYDQVYHDMTLSGSRVLAVGYKYIQNTPISSAKQLTRSDLESKLEFGGFLVVSCPLKSDSKSVMKDILESSHHVAMITGDNELTACHVAKELKIVDPAKKDNSKIMVLRAVENKRNGSPEYEKSGSLESKLEGDKWAWTSIDGKHMLPLEKEERNAIKSGGRNWWKKYSFCLTGTGLQFLQDLSAGDSKSSVGHLLSRWVPRVNVFARVSPQQKEDVVTLLKQLGYHTLMCGDGTNDVGALKHAHCGVALLSKPLKLPAKKSNNPLMDMSLAASSQNGTASIGQHSASSPTPFAIKSRGGAVAPSANSRAAQHARAQARADEIMKKSPLAQKLMKDLEEAEGPTIVKLGDASIASPFTSKASSIESVCHIMKQGRCTLVTTLQMFKILALNSLIFAYGQSVLYLDGVKFSDTQATLQGLLLAGCFLFVSRSQPLKVLSKERPLPNIFNFYTIMTVFAQFCIHFSSLLFVVKAVKSEQPPLAEGEFVDLEKEFEPNTLNSVVYLVDMGMQVSTFAVNYRGEPFMQSLWSHKPLRVSLLTTFGVVLLLAANMMPELTEWFQLVPFSDQLRDSIVMVIVVDAVGCWIVDRALRFIFGRGSLKQVP